MLENRKDGIGSILEGLMGSRRVDESGTVFDTKIASFISKAMPDEKKFIEKALELLFKSFDNTFGGFVEGSRATTKSLGGSNILTWKVQLREKRDGYYMEKILNGAWKTLGKEVISVPIDGGYYYGISMGINDGDTKKDNFSIRKFRQEQEQHVIIGLEELYKKSEQIDTSLMGGTYRIVIHIPSNVTIAGSDNPYLKENGTVLLNKIVRVAYDAPSREIIWSDMENPYVGLRCSTQSKRGIPEAWADILGSFNGDTTMSDVSKIIDKYKIKTFSYYPMD